MSPARSAREISGLITNFLTWTPSPITSVSALVHAAARLTRLLRGEVLDQLDAEDRAIKMGADVDAQPFTGLAGEWRRLLFPDASPKTFADGYAQAVVFALLLARTEGVDLAGLPLHEVGSQLANDHLLMGRALQLLTDVVAKDFKVTLDMTVRVLGAVDWTRVRGGKRDLYLHLYEHFLEEYDPKLRKQSGTYYSPHEVVEPMVRLAEEALVTRLGKPTGFRDETVWTVDPAMGTGTFLQTVLERVAEQVADVDGPGSVPGVLAKVAKRLTGFEIQMGPYAVAELRTADLLADKGVTGSGNTPRLYVTDTLDDPYGPEAHLGPGLAPIAQSRTKANEVKRTSNVQVVIGNPPYKELSVGAGGWVERGNLQHGRAEHPILADWYDHVTSRFQGKLKNLYVYFWRWGTWKVWESTPKAADGDAGVVCFISR